MQIQQSSNLATPSHGPNVWCEGFGIRPFCNSHNSTFDISLGHTKKKKRPTLKKKERGLIKSPKLNNRKVSPGMEQEKKKILHKTQKKKILKKNYPEKKLP